MKNFQKFLEEITIKGNSGIPGEGSDRREPKYIKNSDDRAKARLGVTGREGQRELHAIGGEMMQILDQSMRIVRGKEDELEELAEKVIRTHYDSILDNVELDIKLLRPGKVKEFMDEEKEESDEEPPSYKELKDPEIKKHVDKAKLLNNVIQGEAKNTKNLLHLPEVMDGLSEIFGARQARELFNMWTRITSLADKMDWIIPIERKANMMERQPEGMAGAVKVEWKKEEKEKKEETEEEAQARIDKLLKSIESGEDDEEIKEIFDNGTPVIKARGVDFPMLLHETVKGIYELLASSSLPAEGDSAEDIRAAEVAKLNTSSAEDEAEDFRYGPEIAADLREFCNGLRGIDKYPNLRDRLFAKMVHRNTMSVDSFLSLMKGILSNSEAAKVKMTELLNIVIEELDDYEDELKKWELGEIIGHDNDSNYKEEDGAYPEEGEEEENEIDRLIKNQQQPKEVSNDYSTWRQADIKKEIDKALDDEDYAKLAKLSPFLKENKIYLKELERINEGINPHHKRYK